MTVDQALHDAIVELKDSGVPDPVVSANVLLMHALDWSREQLLMARQDQISQAQVTHFLSLVALRKKRMPVAYITGEKEFYGRRFMVKEHVLIPRPETEALVDWVLQKYKMEKNIQICDVGTGSGVLAITLAKELPEADVTAVDICKEALAVARKNAQQLDANIQWLESHLLDKVTGVFDLIIANLPYVNEDAEAPLAPEVLKEPRLALFADDQGYDLLNQLIKQAYLKTKPNGWIALEHGQGQQKNLMAKLRETGWMHINGYNDLAGIDRMVVAQKIK